MTEKDQDIERAKGLLSKARSKKQSRFFCQSGGVFYERIYIDTKQTKKNR